MQADTQVTNQQRLAVYEELIARAKRTGDYPGLAFILRSKQELLSDSNHTQVLESADISTSK